MQALYNAVQFVMGLGASIMLPIVLLLVGVAFRMKPLDALKSGLFVGIGFMGINLVIGLLNTAIAGPVAYYQTLGSGFTIVDVPWSSMGAASWAGPYAAIAVVVSLILNVILVELKVVKCLNVDIWNYIHMLIPAGVLYAFFHSFWLSFVYVVVLSVLACVAGYAGRKRWQEQFGLEGTCCSTLSYCLWHAPWMKVCNIIFDKIPGLNKVDVNIEGLNKKIGVIADPCFIGLFVGLLLTLITKQPIATIITSSVQMSAVMVLLPRMVNVFMEGLAGISSAATDYMMKKMGPESDIVIGMDICLGLGDPCALTATTIMIPITIALAFILPIQYFPVGTLTAVCYDSVMPTAYGHGNLVRAVLAHTLLYLFVMSMANYCAPEATGFIRAMGLELAGEGAYMGFGCPQFFIPALIIKAMGLSA